MRQNFQNTYEKVLLIAYIIIMEVSMFFFGSFCKKTVKELRKNRGLTARELAQRLKLDTVEIMKIDEMRLRDVPEPMQSLITPILRGDDTDRIPWL